MNEEILIKKYEKIIRVIVNGLKNIDLDTKEDIMQDLRIFLIEHIKPKMNSLDQSTLNNYIFVLLKRKTIDILRSNTYRINQSLNQKVNVDDDQELIDLIPCDETLSHQEDTMSEELESFIKTRFKKREQMLIRLYFYENLTYKEIGKKLKISVDTARRHINKILAIIKKEFHI